MIDFSSFGTVRDALAAAPVADAAARAEAEARNAELTKPQGALGRLEEIAIWVAGWQRSARPRITAPQCIVFAGNHGVCAQGISAFPPEVTVQMVGNFKAGGAAINQLARTAGAQLDVVALELDRPTQDFTIAPAMTEDECLAAMAAGAAAVAENTDLLVVGEMGIGNTTSAAAIALARFGGSGADWAGRGTGLDDAGVAHKAAVIEAGLTRNPEARETGLSALAALGGRELAAMAGAVAEARVRRIPVLLDGFIATAAVACLSDISGALEHVIAAHQSAEGAHGALLQELGLEPLLHMGLRLGEGSGAALAIPLLRAALECHSGMATFAEAAVASGA